MQKKLTTRTKHRGRKIGLSQKSSNEEPRDDKHKKKRKKYPEESEDVEDWGEAAPA